MHIGIDLILQKVNSNIISSLEPEEKDWVLNEEMYRFIKQRTEPKSNDKRLGFERNQKRYDDIKPLLQPATLSCYTRDTESVFSFLPSDYIFLVNDRSLTKDLCGNAYSTVGTTAVNKHILCLPILDDENLYVDTIISINDVELFSTANYPQFEDGLSAVDAKFQLIPFIIEALRKAGYECKYEYFHSIQCLGGIVVVGDVALEADVYYGDTHYIYQSTTQSYTKINSNISGLKEYENRLSRTQDIHTIRTYSFSKSVFDSPISGLEQGKIYAYHEQKFIIAGINIEYIRKPKQISLPLNQGCELDEPAQKEIVENSAKRIAGLTGSQNYPNIINENLLKE